MKYKYLLSLWQTPIFILIFALFAYALDKDEEEAHLKKEQIGKVKRDPEIAPEKKEVVEVGTGWVWGDVLFIDKEDGQFVVNYLDYDDLSNKDIVLSVDEETVFENAEGLSQLQINDNLSVDYIVTDTGKNIARLITVGRLQQFEE